MSATTLRDGRIVDLVDNLKTSHICLIQYGTYTGDGNTSLTVTTYFDPLYVRIWLDDTAGAGKAVYEKVSGFTGTTLAYLDLDGDTDIVDNAIIELGTLNFKVDDAGADSHPNKLNQVYRFLALGELT